MAKPTPKDIIYGLLRKLDIDESRLASMLAVSVVTVRDWREQSAAELAKGKGNRLVRLNQVVDYLVAKISDAPERILEILEDGRVPIADAGEDDSISLISYICAAPEDMGWEANVNEAIRSA